MCSNRTTILVLLVIVGSVVVVFWRQILGLAIFIGDSDRLNSYLNIRLAEYDSLSNYGRMVGWDDHMFAGMSLAALHWMNVGADPVPWLLHLFERGQVYRVLGLISIGSVLAACIAAYAYLRDVIAAGFLAAVGAVCYGLSVFSIHRIAQVDNAHLTVVVIPLALLAIRHVRADNLFRPFLGLSILLSILVYFGFLQEVAYAYLFFAIYAVYRSAISRRSGWKAAAAPLAIFAMAGLVSLLLALPRLLTVASDFFLLVRSDRFNCVGFGQLVRLFHEGIYGRYFEEGLLLQNALNLSEGVQLVSSATLVLVVCYGILRPRRGASLVAAVVFAAMILALWRPGALTRFLTGWFVIGISETLLVICFYAGLIAVGLGAYAMSAYAMARRSASPIAPRNAPTASASSSDEPFHLFATVILLLLILTPEGYSLVHNVFGRADFTHSRLSVLLVLPLCTLFCIYASGLMNSPSEPSSPRLPGDTRLKLAGAIVVVAGLVSWLLHGRWIDRLIPLDAFEFWPYDHFRAVAVVVAGTIISTVLLGMVLLGAALLVYRKRVDAVNARFVVACVVVSFALVETISYAAFKVGGPQTWTYPIAFRNFNYLNVRSSALRPPSEKKLAKFAEALETGGYRSVLLNEPARYRIAKTSHISEFWRARLIGGYASGVPKRLAELPWSQRAQWLREIELTSLSDADLHLLALLNVKFIVLPTPDLFFNVASEGIGDFRREIRSSDGTVYAADIVNVNGVRFSVVRNPIKPLPRQFFAKTVTGVSQTPRVRIGAKPSDTAGEPVISDIAQLPEHSLAEGLRGTQAFDAGGELDVTYRGDTIDIRMSPADRGRFVVLNERYHPDWRARSGGLEMPVLPTNAVMMGIAVPAGIDRLQLRFEPVSHRTRGLIGVALAAFVLMAGGLRFAETRSRKAEAHIEKA